MEGRSHSSSSSSGSSLGNSPELRPKCPKSPPPGALDLYGKRRQTVKVQVLEREIGLLQVGIIVTCNVVILFCMFFKLGFSLICLYYVGWPTKWLI